MKPVQVFSEDYFHVACRDVSEYPDGAIVARFDNGLDELLFELSLFDGAYLEFQLGDIVVFRMNHSVQI